MKTIVKLSIQLSILMLSSCSSTKFMSRKYTSGVFLQHNKTLKNNTVSVDTTKQYASLTKEIILKKPDASLVNCNEQDIINTLTNSIIKKDSFFVYQRRGKDARLKKYCEGENVLIVINHDFKVSKIKVIDYEPSGFRVISDQERLTSKSFMTSVENATIGFLIFLAALALIIVLGLVAYFNYKH